MPPPRVAKGTAESAGPVGPAPVRQDLGHRELAPDTKIGSPRQGAGEELGTGVALGAVDASGEVEAPGVMDGDGPALLGGGGVATGELGGGDVVVPGDGAAEVPAAVVALAVAVAVESGEPAGPGEADDCGTAAPPRIPRISALYSSRWAITSASGIVGIDWAKAATFAQTSASAICCSPPGRESTVTTNWLATAAVMHSKQS
jgi:hypothetical protein